MGNETQKIDTAKQYYRLRLSEIYFSPSIYKELGRKHTLGVGLSYQSVRVEDTEDRFISDPSGKLDSSDFNRQYFGHFYVNYLFNTTDHFLYPTKGVKIHSELRYIHNLEETSQNFARWLTEASFYVSLNKLTFANRTGVSTNLGDDYEFYQASILGGLTNLRGYLKERFAGKTSFYNNTELRFKLNNINAYIVKGNWGLLGFLDNGRVWVPEETSNKWHVGYGGGVWFLPFNAIAFNAIFAASQEENIINISGRFLF